MYSVAKLKYQMLLGGKNATHFYPTFIDSNMRTVRQHYLMGKSRPVRMEPFASHIREVSEVFKFCI